MGSITTWARIEPHSRAADMDSGLEMRIHDPLWMLTRQWQFGEFQGEEAGSCITAKIALRESRISEVTLGWGLSAQTERFDATSSPLAPKALALPHTFDSPTRAQCGLHFVRLLEKTLSKNDARAVGVSLCSVLPIQSLKPPASPTMSDVIAYERERANEKAFRLQRLLSKRAF